MRVQTIFIRKPENIEVVKNLTNIYLSSGEQYEDCEISLVINMDKINFKDFCNNLFLDNDFISKYKKLCHNKKYLLIKEVNSDISSGLIVDPSGFDYARYVGIPKIN